jgi:hypothetical protein
MVGKFAYYDGHIISETPEDELHRKIMEHPLWKITADSKIDVTLDHTGKLLRLTRQFAKRREPNVAILLAATWIEHWVNGLVLERCSKLKLTTTEHNRMLRDVGQRGSYGS